MTMHIWTYVIYSAIVMSVHNNNYALRECDSWSIMRLFLARKENYHDFLFAWGLAGSTLPEKQEFSP